jgi:uncharacterized protein (TIGR02145 family)
MKAFNVKSLLIISIGFLFVMSACDPSENPDTLPVLTTSEASFIDENNIKCGGTISSDGGSKVIERGVCWSKTSMSPTISGNSKTSDGNGIGTFTSTITGLTAGTTYYIRAYATSAAGTGYGGLARITTLSTAEEIIDNDGNIIKTINIGSQTWMTENLKNVKYRTGEMISNLTSATDWKKATFGACCYYNNNPGNAAYGLLYNWAAITDSRNITPKGWHVATYDDWVKLINFLGPDSAGAKLKEMGIAHWSSPNAGAINSVGFTALPGGLRNPDGTFGYINDFGNWWTSTEFDSSNGRYWYLRSDKIDTRKDYDNKMYGYSVRCVKD